MRSNFSLNWLARVLGGLAVAAISLQVGWIFGRSWWQVGAVCSVLALGGIGFAVYTEVQDRRRRHTRQASHSVSLPASWSVKFDKRTPDGWLAPIAVIRDDGMRFVIDIRQWRDARWSPDKEGTTEAWFEDSRGKRLFPDPLPNLQKAAIATSAAPVVWLPQVEEAGTHRHRQSHVLLITGSARDLKNALQAVRAVNRPADAEQEA